MSNSLWRTTLVVTLALSACGTPAPTGPLSQTDLLDQLGVDTGLEPAAVGPDGARLPDGYHPLRKQFTALEPRAELYWAGWSRDGHTEGLLDDGFTAMPFASKMTPLDESWTTNAEKAAVAADLDGDGIEEIVVVYYVPANPPALPDSELRVKRVSGKAAAGGGLQIVDGAAQTVLTKLAPSGNPAGWLQNGVAAVDVDGDGKDEIVVAYRDVYVLDAQRDFAVLQKLAYDSARISVTAGDFDAAPGDKLGEFAVCATFGNSTFVDTYDGLVRTGHREVLFTLNDPARTVFAMTEGIIAAGNFDADNADELVLYGNRRGNDHWHVILMDDANHDHAWFRGLQFWATEGAHDGMPENPTLLTLDLDGDKIDEVFADMRVIAGLQNVAPSGSFATVNDVNHPPGVTSFEAHFGGYQPLPFSGFTWFHRATQVTRGNVTAIGETATRSGTEELIAVNPLNHQLVMGLINAMGQFVWQPVPGSGGTASSVRDVLVAANVDRDSALVRYDGDHQLKWTDPQVVALLSAAPFYDAKSGISQQLGNSYTAFGTATSTTDLKERSLGFSVGRTFGYEANFLNLAKTKWKVSLEAAFDTVASNSREHYQSVTFATGVEDSAVFTVVPFDVYRYTVVSAPEGAEADVGKVMTINMPRKPQTLLATAAFFDANNGEGADISPLFHHTVGDPKSYPGDAAADEACGTAKCFRSESYGVGEGSGFTELMISEASATSTKLAFDFSQTFSFEVSGAGVTSGASVRFHEGWAIQLTTTQWTVFTGRVGHITGLTPATSYRFGLFAHPVAYAGAGNQTLMVDYWVE